MTIQINSKLKVAPAFKLGVEDFSRGHKTNPFPFGRERRQWAAGFEQAQRAALQQDKKEESGNRD